MSRAEPLSNLSQLSLDDLVRHAGGQTALPVENWHPKHVGTIDIRIAVDGRWIHEGGEIKRPAMVRLFSSILRREEDGSYVLVTPAEKLAITVDDAPFIAVELKSEGEGAARELALRLNTGDIVIAGPEHVIVSRGTEEAPAHYIHVRGGLEARLARSVYYELAEIAIAEQADPLGVWSDGAFFAL